MTPWVLTNYAARIGDVTTLAQELGHAVHAMMAEDHSIFTFHSALPLVETASVFAEMLVTDRMVCEERERAVRRYLMATVLVDAYATMARQAYFLLFEQEAHRQALEGATVAALSDLHLRTLRSSSVTRWK